jgi:hypothetical protein
VAAGFMAYYADDFGSQHDVHRVHERPHNEYAAADSFEQVVVLNRALESHPGRSRSPDQIP